MGGLRIAIGEIIVPENRQRREFPEKELNELADSIASKGLMHPIVLRNDNRTLVAGERRLRAISRLYEQGKTFSSGGEVVPPGTVPYTRLGDLTDLEVREAELEENTIRVDLTWQERMQAIAELHELRAAQAAERGEKHTIADSTREIFSHLGVETGLGIYHQEVSNALKLAENLQDPEIASAKSEKEALKILRKKKEAEHRARLAEEFASVETPHVIISGDAFEAQKQLMGNFDIIITDPPYGIEADTFGSQASAAHKYVDDLTSALRCYELVFKLAAERQVRAVFAFCDIRIFPSISEIAHQVLGGFAIWDTPLIWYKNNGMLPVPERGPRRQYEAIFYAYTSRTVWATPGSPDVFEIPTVPSPAFGAQKPPALYQTLLSRVILPGDRVLDPFAGTCPVIPAAEELQAVATCIEMSQEKVNWAKAEYLVNA